MTVVEEPQYGCNVCNGRHVKLPDKTMSGLKRLGDGRGQAKRVPCSDSLNHVCHLCAGEIARLFPVPEPRLEEMADLLEEWRLFGLKHDADDDDLLRTHHAIAAVDSSKINQHLEAPADGA